MSTVPLALALRLDAQGVTRLFGEIVALWDGARAHIRSRWARSRHHWPDSERGPAMAEETA